MQHNQQYLASPGTHLQTLIYVSMTTYTFRVGNHWIKTHKIQGTPKQLRPQTSLRVKYFTDLEYTVAPS